jgi:hypothetical protein
MIWIEVPYRPQSQRKLRQKRGADASGLTPERKSTVLADGQVASQQTGEVFVDCGAARFNFDEKDDLNYFVRTITPQGEQRIYWGKDLPRALEEAGAKVGESITATRGGEQACDSSGNPGAAGRLKANSESRCQAWAVAGG